MENIKQESGNDNLTIVDDASPNEGETSPTVENELPKELSVPSVSNNKIQIGFVEKFIYTAVIPSVVIGGGIVIGANMYEASNNCAIVISDVVECVPSSPIRPRSLNNDYQPACKGCAVPFKPLILLYPETEQEVSVELEYTPGFSATFPRYDNAKNGWSVTANPDGTLLDHTTQQETYGLFWEGNSTDSEFDLSKGWIVASRDLRNFLYEKLTEIGLNTKEKSDFIMFWYPKLQEYPYVQITFAGEDYNQSAPLKITPKPDSILRVFMVAKPLDTPKKIEPQKLEKFERKGFSVVEWGGTILE